MKGKNNRLSSPISSDGLGTVTRPEHEPQQPVKRILLAKDGNREDPVG